MGNITIYGHIINEFENGEIDIIMECLDENSEEVLVFVNEHNRIYTILNSQQQEIDINFDENMIYEYVANI